MLERFEIQIEEIEAGLTLVDLHRVDVAAGLDFHSLVGVLDTSVHDVQISVYPGERVTRAGLWYVTLQREFLPL